MTAIKIRAVKTKYVSTALIWCPPQIAYWECYDPRASKWESFEEPLTTEKSDARAVTIGNTVGSLYYTELTVNDITLMPFKFLF